MKIYTKSGDEGKTDVIGRQRLMKDDDRIEAYGELDEVNALIGLVRSCLTEQKIPFSALNQELLEIQQLLFDAGTDLANVNEQIPFRLEEDAVAWLEQRIDEHEAGLPKIEQFILPGGCQLSAWLHVARTVTRRAERRIVRLLRNDTINLQVLIFINRLSDYLFVIARSTNYQINGEELFYRNSGRVFR